MRDCDGETMNWSRLIGPQFTRGGRIGDCEGLEAEVVLRRARISLLDTY